MNTLHYGDCLTVMQGMKAGSVDMIYLDPPFNSKRNYHSIYKDETGRPLPDQVEAFCDMWTLTPEREREIRHMPVLVRETGIPDNVAEFWKVWLNALRKTNPALLAYLSYMVIRLAHMRVLLKSTGTLYLHCDPTASHYIKVILDGVFGHANFRNEIVWSYQRWTGATKHFQRMHDILLMYARSRENVFNQLQESHSEKGKRRHKGQNRTTQIEQDGSLTQTYVDTSGTKAMRDVWEISHLNANAKERMGYATQKPLALLERVIAASTNPDDVVLDPFCGCATTLEAAHKLNRRWIGIDIAIHAVKRVARIRLTDRCGLVEGTDFEVLGVPRDVEGAHDLWKRNPYHFQKWAVEQVDGFVTTKQTADGGIDGRLYFAHPGHRDLQSMVIEVKGGATVNIADVRALGDVLRRDAAMLAGLIVMEISPGKAKNFGALMAEAGDLDVLGVKYPRMQMLTVAQIVAGERFQTPSVAARNVVDPKLPLGL